MQAFFLVWYIINSKPTNTGHILRKSAIFGKHNNLVTKYCPQKVA